MSLADRLDHVSIATHRMAPVVALFRDVLGARFLMGGDEPAQGFRWAQFEFPGGGVIEVMEPLGESGFLQDFLRRHGEGLHHVTLRVTDIAARAADLQAQGLHPVKANFSNPVWKEMFLHPRETHGVLIQLAESELSYADEVRYYQAVPPEVRE